MKIVILGGYGVFGGRLARLLIRDGHSVWIAGRSFLKAGRFTARYGGQPIQLDLTSGLQPIRQVNPHTVVDAAGPFQAYGEDAYRVAEFCIEHRINYLDLSDDGRFTAGIGQLDKQAKAAGCFVLSGASSVPAISSSVVADLSADLSSIDVIETAIMPGNRAPRGRSVISSILSQIGGPMKVWRGGQWRITQCWSDPRAYQLGIGVRRQAWLIGVPDLILFPQFFSARSVLFRAGLELWVMNASLSALAFLRRNGVLRMTPVMGTFAYYLSLMLERFGSDEGGMIVAVTGQKDRQTTTRCWQLIAEAGEGPFIPAIAVRTLLRNSASVAPGARPCLSQSRLSEIEDAMSDLAVKISTSEEQNPTLFQSALREKWHDLPPTVQRMHSVHDIETFSGRANVERGTSLVARVSAWFFGFPPAGTDIPLTITKTRTGTGETWQRDFDGNVFRSYLTPSRPYHYKERFWAFNFEQELPVKDGVLHLPVKSGRFLGIPLPRFLLPGSNSREFEVDGKFHFDVGLSAPFGGGLIVRYHGSVSPDA
jgi:saccharopine dehydrogenase-like NADP-dependent oxidoreductase